MDNANTNNDMKANNRTTSYRRAFTALEILIVVSIIALLIAGIAYMAVKPQQQAAVERTRSAMEAVKGMLEELRLSTDLQGFYTSTTTVIDASGSPMVADEDSSQWVNFTYAVNTQALMQKILSVPANKQAMAKLPAEMFKTFGGSSIPVPVDGWGSPIILIPPGGIKVKDANGVVKLVTSAGILDANKPTPMGAKGFWISAGSDRNFQTGKDNVYSFDNK